MLSQQVFDSTTALQAIQISSVKKAKIIHIDIDPAEIDKNVTIDVPIVGDLKRVLTELNALVEPAKHEAWLEQIRQWQEEYPIVVPESTDGELHPQYVLSELNKNCER